MRNRLFETRSSLALLLVRFPLGLDMFVHGYQKVTHIPGTMRYYDGLGVPHPLAWLAIIAEFCGGIGLMIGMLSRIAAFGVGCNKAKLLLVSNSLYLIAIAPPESRKPQASRRGTLRWYRARDRQRCPA